MFCIDLVKAAIPHWYRDGKKREKNVFYLKLKFEHSLRNGGRFVKLKLLLLLSVVKKFNSEELSEVLLTLFANKNVEFCSTEGHRSRT